MPASLLLYIEGVNRLALSMDRTTNSRGLRSAPDSLPACKSAAAIGLPGSSLPERRL
jgi:hypothetical protein